MTLNRVIFPDFDVDSLALLLGLESEEHRKGAYNNTIEHPRSTHSS